MVRTGRARQNWHAFREVAATAILPLQ